MTAIALRLVLPLAVLAGLAWAGMYISGDAVLGAFAIALTALTGIAATVAVVGGHSDPWRNR